MSINLDNTLKPIENLNVQSFEEQLDFLGTYSGLTAYKFSRCVFFLNKFFIIKYFIE